jgi:hypothetical protein
MTCGEKTHQRSCPVGNQFPLNVSDLIKIGLHRQFHTGRDATRGVYDRAASIRPAIRYKVAVHGKPRLED